MRTILKIAYPVAVVAVLGAVVSTIVLLWAETWESRTWYYPLTLSFWAVGIGASLVVQATRNALAARESKD